MKSVIAKELKLRHEPVGVFLTDNKPDDALQFEEGKGGCMVPLLTAVASEGQTAVFDAKTHGCGGARIGLGFGAAQRPDGDFAKFLSTGTGEGSHPRGEGYKKTPELAQELIDGFPVMDVDGKYRVFKPLSDVNPEAERPELVILYANPDQLSALVVLANYGRTGADNVAIPFSAGCHTICAIPYQEAQREKLRAIVGMVDISARPHVDADILTFTVPYDMFLELEEDAPESFLNRGDWQKVYSRIPN